MRLGKFIAGSAALAALALLICGGARAQDSGASQGHDMPAPSKHKSRTQSQPQVQTKAPLPVAPASDQPTGEVSSGGSHRDPFQSLLDANKGGGPSNLPAGKAGLIISTVRIDGTVKADNGMIAVVSNPQDRVYFIHEGDRLYDGQVEKIGLDGVVFRQVSKDAFGKPVEREVTKRLYASAGEQQ